MPEAWRVGLFAHERLEAWMRFSSDTGPTDPDLGSMCGIGLKLFGVDGPNALGEEGATADLIMQNIDRFFLDTAKTMVEFTYAGVVQHDYDAYLAKHPAINAVLNDMNAARGSCLTNRYWAILPFHLGDELVKYRLDPETPAEDVPDDGNDYLKTDLINRLAERDYRFTLSVQRRTNEKTMPLDAANVVWPEEESPISRSRLWSSRASESMRRGRPTMARICPSTSGACRTRTGPATSRRSRSSGAASMRRARQCASMPMVS